MALADLRAFLIEKLQTLDNTMDLSPGSPADVKVIQPVLRRLGTDPFSVDIGRFIQERLNQEFPTMATKEGDAIADLLIKAAIILWNPIVREIGRVRANQSFKDPSTLSAEEAEALGANLFAKRETGKFARGVGRIYFAQPQKCSVSPANFFTSKSNLHFFPTEVQSIRTEEMLLNVEGSLYYFDVNLIAEAAGDGYNIDKEELISIANIASAVRVTNKSRFREGTPDEDAVSFVDRIEQELTERSMVTQRGVIAKVTRDFPEVTRINPIGFNDPEMQRDVLRGGGFGHLLAGGVAGSVIADGESHLLSRRFSVADPDVDFASLIGPSGNDAPSFWLTVVNAFAPGSLPVVRDIQVKAVVNGTTLDLAEQVLSYGATSNVAWMLRKKTLTLSGIPGGVLFPDTLNGTTSTIPDDAVHIGGATDVYLRGDGFDDGVLVLSSIVDDRPILKGTDAHTNGIDTNLFVLGDLLLGPALGANYSTGDETYRALERVKEFGLSLQVFDAPNAGTYRVLDVIQSTGGHPVLQIDGILTLTAVPTRWRITESVTIDLSEPKETKVTGADLRCLQGSNIVDTESGTDFDAYGVAANDILRVMSGNLVVGDYTVQQVLSPAYQKLKLDRNLPATVSNVKYAVFRPNAAGGLELPFIRIDSIDLLDTHSQPVGATIPYAKPVDVRTKGFANTARGIKADMTDVTLGIITQNLGAGANVSGKNLTFSWAGQVPFTCTFSGSNPLSPAAIAAQLNTAASAATAGVVSRFAVVLDSDRVGVLPVGDNVVLTAGTARDDLFAGVYGGTITVDTVISSRDVNSGQMHRLGGWASLRPDIDLNFDVVQVLDGLQIGFYGNLVVQNEAPFQSNKYDPLVTDKDFSPEVRRHAQVGARSLGTARVFFLDPTSFEVNAGTKFTVEADDGSELHFFPDPTNDYQRIPPLPSGTKPTDGSTGGSLATNIFQSLTTDFIQKGITRGDLLSIDYIPLVGTVSLADPVPNLAAKTLALSVDGAPDKLVIFVHDDTAIPSTSVTRQGVVDQINRTIGKTICELDGSNRLQFNPDASVIVRGSSLSSSANLALGFSTVTSVDQNNDSPNKGTYTILQVAPGGDAHLVTITSTFPMGVTGVSNQQFKVRRAGVQRIVSTDMAKQTVSPSLYYFDVQLVSEGTGDQYNLVGDLPMTVEGYRSDGYYLETEDPNLSFSPIERPILRLSPSVLQVGVSDDPANATLLVGQNLQVNYSKSSLVDNVNSFALSDTERVINQSPLVRHLIPHFVRFNLTYAGGSKEEVILPDIEKFIKALFPRDYLDSSDLQKIVLNRGAMSVDNPIDLIAVVHQADRTVLLERSQDKLNTGRLAAFIPDVISLKRRIS